MLHGFARLAIFAVPQNRFPITESGIGNRQSGISNRESAIRNQQSAIGNRQSVNCPAFLKDFSRRLWINLSPSPRLPLRLPVSFKTTELHCCASLEGIETEFRDKLLQLGGSCGRLPAYRYRHSATKTATGRRRTLGLDPIRDEFPSTF